MVNHLVLLLLGGILPQALHHLEGDELAGGRLLHARPVDGIPEGLVPLGFLDLVDVGVVLVEDVDLAGVHELPVRADGRVRVLVADQVLRVALLELVEDHRRRLLLVDVRLRLMMLLVLLLRLNRRLQIAL